MNNKIAGLLFAIVMLILTLICCYWAFLQGGAKYWSDGIRRIHGRRGDFVGRPVVVKVFVCSMLLASMLAVILALAAIIE
jgi:hypothetical protein